MPASRLSGLLHRFRVPLGALLVVALALAGWYLDEIRAWFARAPTPALIAGTWTMDEAAYAAGVAETVAAMPPERAAEMKARLEGFGAGYRGAVYDFRAEAYSVTRTGATGSWPCTYAGVPTNMLVVRASGPGAPHDLSLVLDLGHDHLYIAGIEMPVPLKRRDAPAP